MKNKKLMITLIVLFSIIVISVIGFILFSMKGIVKMNLFNVGYKISNNLVIEDSYDIDFNEIKINATDSEVLIKETKDEIVKVKVYGKSQYASVKTNDNILQINYNVKKSINIFFKRTIGKIEVYLPENYQNLVNIDTNFGDINIGDFENATMSVKADCGNITVKSGAKIDIKADLGNIEVIKAKSLKIKESLGNILVKEVDEVDIKNDMGKTFIDNINVYLNIINDLGEINIKNINITKDSNIKNSVGKTNINKTNDIYILATSNVGKVKINNNNPKSEIKLTINNDVGDVLVNN